MRIARKGFILSVALLGAILLGAGTVLAFNSATFANRAQAWTSAQCTQKLINGKDNTANNRTATICYNYYENQQQDQSISKLTSATSGVLVDGNGNILGPMSEPANGYEEAGTGYAFFDSQLKRVVQVTASGALQPFDISFASNNCTGTPYAIRFGSNQFLYKGNTTTPGHYLYYVVANSNLPATTVTVNSITLPDGTCGTGNPVSLPATGNAFQLTPVSINFSDPIAMPIHFQ